MTKANTKPAQTTLRGLDANLWRRIEAHRKRLERKTELPWSQNRTILALIKAGLEIVNKT